MNSDVSLRIGSEHDAEDIARFYKPYVMSTAVNFEYDSPDAAEFRQRIRKVLEKFPFIVAVRDNTQVIGYTFAHPMGDRPAFAWSVGTSIYLDQSVRGRHVGSALYAALEAILVEQHIVNVFSCITVRRHDALSDIGGPRTEDGIENDTVDAHLPATSPRFHTALGFKPVGREYSCGNKFGNWYDKLWMEKHISERTFHPTPVISLQELSQETITNGLRAGEYVLESAPDHWTT